MSPPHESVEFLTAIWGKRMPEGLYAQVWAKKGEKSRSTSLQHWAGVVGVVTTHAAADVYVGCAATAKKIAPTVRAKAKDAAAIPGFWADLDVGPGRAPDLDAAVAATKLVEAPSVIVASGGGVHAWWLFDEPWIFIDEEERAEAGRQCAGWVETLRRACGFTLDSVGELARVLRLPGTTNHKGGVERPVSILDQSGVRFPRAQLLVHAGAHRGRSAATDAEEGGASLGDLPTADDVPIETIRAMRAADDVFDRTWTRKRKGVALEWSDSEYDLAILTMLLRAGLDEKSAVAAAAHARREYGNPEKADKVDRLDYWQRTVRKARNGGGPDDQALDAKREEAKLVGELRELRETPAAAVPATTPDRWAKLNQLVGGGVGPAPRVVEWHQYGTDPDMARHVWVLSDGVEAPIGIGSGVLTQARVKQVLMSVSSIFRAGDWKKQTWELGIATVLPLRIFHADPEHEREQRALEWVAQVVNDRSIESDVEHLNDAILFRRPFVRDGRLHIAQGYLGQQLRVQRIAPEVRDADLAPLLRASGFERGTVNFDKGEGHRGSRSYWSIEEDLMP